MAKTAEEKLADVQQKIVQLKNQEKQLLQQQKEEANKARTHRLIERGAIAESLMSLPDTVTNEQFKEVLAIALNSDTARTALFALREQKAAKPEETTEEVLPEGGA